MTSTNRILKNTLMLYFRQILILLVSLYTVRVVLTILGVEDYGIYSVVGGIVSFFSFLSGTMASATQRFFSFALGQKNELKLKTTFSVNLVIYILIAVISVILLESLGTFYVYNKLNIPMERFSAACFIYHFSVITFIFSIFSSPFMAIIIAHEDMQIYAYVSIVEVLLKLGIVFLLNIITADKLKIYGLLLAFVAFFNATIYIVICIKKYSECQFKKFYWSREQFRETFQFTGWTLFGQLTSVIRTQAVTILINQVFNPIVVSARTVAMQVSNYIKIFSANFNTGLYPAIIKKYASNEKEEMFSLVFNGCKTTFFLMWIFALPLFMEMDYVLTLWLKVPPEQVILFTRLAFIEVLIDTICLPLMTAARAPGKMMGYELSLGIIQVSIFVADYLILKFFNAPAYIVFVIAAIGNFLMFFIRLINVKYLIDFPVLVFLRKVILRIFIVMCITFGFSYGIHIVRPYNFSGVCLSVFVTVLFSIVTMCYVGLNKIERNKIFQFIKTKFPKKVWSKKIWKK
ncbi:MAG: hypothetical protein MJ185_02080 [Treponema sp.]|nr:hypothetical protein [Treponema sp.]